MLVESTTGLNPEEVANNSQEMPIFVPSVLSFSDYYPFGMMMPGRHGESSFYRYGFNGMEKDDEVKGSGNSYNYKKRLFDSRIGRFFKTDLLETSYPMLTPYQFASNRPIDGFDLDGNEWAVKTTKATNDQGELVITNEFVVKVKVINESKLITDPKIIKAKAELIKQAVENKYSGKFTESKTGKVTKFVYKTTVVLDYTSPPKDHENIGYLIFDDRKTIYHKDKAETYVDDDGSIITETPTEQIFATTENRINLFRIRIGITMDGKLRNDARLQRTGQHEFGHSASLNHPWELSKLEKSLVPDLDQNSKDAKSETIKNNIMNSGGNPNLKNRSLEGKKLLPGQVKAMSEKINKYSVYSNDELLDNNKDK